MPNRMISEVKFNESGDCVKIGDHMVRLYAKKGWWHRFLPCKVRFMVYSDTGSEQKYWHGKWWKV